MQQRRRRRLTPRGRVTLLIAAFAAAGLAAVGWGERAGDEASPEAGAAAPFAGTPLPPVSASPGGAATGPVTEERLVDAVLSDLPVTSAVLSAPSLVATPGEDEADPPRNLVASVPVQLAPGREPTWLRVDYTLDAELTRRVFRILEQARVELGHVVVIDPTSGRVLAYASTDPERFPPTRTYPAASLIKVVTAAAALDADPEVATRPCHFVGSPYRLTRKRLDPPRRGNETTLRKALATSNNQCFAQLAVHTVGASGLLAAIDRFGLREPPAPGHPAGSASAGDDPFDLGKLGCGLDGCRITPLHAARLAATLASGVLREPYWVERIVGPDGRPLALPEPAEPRQVLTPALAARLRDMLVDTTARGTARRAFRDRRGRPLLGPVRVAGKTGSLSGHDPTGRYEWFIGAAPAEAPTVAVATLLVQGDLWWRSSSQVAAAVLHEIFCPDGPCSAAAAARWTAPPPEALGPPAPPGPGVVAAR